MSCGRLSHNFGDSKVHNSVIPQVFDDFIEEKWSTVPTQELRRLAL